MALAQSYAFVLAAETLGRVRAVLRPDARRSMFRVTPVDSFNFLPGPRGQERTRHELETWNVLGTNL